MPITTVPIDALDAKVDELESQGHTVSSVTMVGDGAAKVLYQTKQRRAPGSKETRA